MPPPLDALLGRDTSCHRLVIKTLQDLGLRRGKMYHGRTHLLTLTYLTLTFLPQPEPQKTGSPKAIAFAGTTLGYERELHKLSIGLRSC